MASIFGFGEYLPYVVSNEEREKVNAACRTKIANAIAGNKECTYLFVGNELEKWRGPSLDRIYHKISDDYWNDRQISISFENDQLTTSVYIDYGTDAAARSKAVKENKEEYERMLAMIQRQFKELESSTKEVVIKWNASSQFSFTGVNLSHLMREVSANLEGGRIVRIDGLWAIRRT